MRLGRNTNEHPWSSRCLFFGFCIRYVKTGGARSLQGAVGFDKKALRVESAQRNTAVATDWMRGHQAKLTIHGGAALG